MRYYIIAGEASGDLHASNLMVALRSLDPQAEFRCWGGYLMQAQGGNLAKHYKDLAFMGFIEVLSHLPTILRNFNYCEEDLTAFKPDVVILVDYPGFNLRVAKMSSSNGFRVFYYISPQLWAWHTSRVHKVKEFVERMFVILPFEPDFYEKYNYHVDYEGHPLLDVINASMKLPSRADFYQKNGLPDKPIIALLPGSRKMEISKMLRIMLSVQDQFSEFQFVIAGVPSIHPDFYKPLIRNHAVSIIQDQTYDLLSHSEAALVTSGTATLETALMGIPQVVCYKGNPLSYFIARQVVKVKYISLVNLICNQQLVPELIQSECTPQRLALHLKNLLYNNRDRKRILEGYTEIKSKLGGPGASLRVAKKIVQYLNANQVSV